MNQMILIRDDQQWSDEKQWISFSAQVGGGRVMCAVRKQTLLHLSNEAHIDECHAMQVYQALRFDIEEQIEAAIENEDFNEEGWVVI